MHAHSGKMINERASFQVHLEDIRELTSSGEPSTRLWRLLACSAWHHDSDGSLAFHVALTSIEKFLSRTVDR